MNAVDEARFASVSHAPPLTDVAITDRFVMMYHGTLTRTYGLDIAVEAFGIAHEEMPGAEMWILGSGPDQGPLAELAQRRGLASKVKLIGQVASNEIPAWLSKCDLGILPFRRDVFLDFAFPNKLPEFIVAGRAVAISRLKAIRHYFSEEALAYFEPNSPSDLAKQMVRVYRDRSLRERLVLKAKEEYGPIRWDVMKDRYLELVDRLGFGVLSADARHHETALRKYRSEKADVVVTGGTIDLFTAGGWVKVPAAEINGNIIVVAGRAIKTAAIHDEEWLEHEIQDPEV